MVAMSRKNVIAFFDFFENFNQLVLVSARKVKKEWKFTIAIQIGDFVFKVD